MYPQLEINLSKIKHNAQKVTSMCEKFGIDVCAVIKGTVADPEVTKTYRDGGAKYTGTSRLSQIESLKKAGAEGPFMLLRVPMMCELDKAAELADYSLHSDVSVLEEFDRSCAKAGVVRKVIIMFDLGDLREGFWDKEEGIQACVHVENDLKNLELAGIGVNLGCYGAIQPTPEKMNDLVSIAREIEKRIGRKLEMVSGGATSSFSLVHWDKMPEGITNLRIGEGVLLAYDIPYTWNVKDMNYLYDDTFVLRAQILEVRTKASYPQGQFCIDAFGNKPVFTDRGMRKRALAGIGRMDVGEAEKLIPVKKGIEVIGASSDHIILDVEDFGEELKPGDIVEFTISYSNILNLHMSPDIERVYVK